MLPTDYISKQNGLICMVYRKASTAYLMCDLIHFLQKETLEPALAPPQVIGSVCETLVFGCMKVCLNVTV